MLTTIFMFINHMLMFCTSDTGYCLKVNMTQQQQQQMLSLLLLALVINVTYGCSCMDTFETRVTNAQFAALAKVTSDIISSPEGLYHRINQKCVLKSPYGTNVRRAYATHRPRPAGIRTSCDGSDLDKDKVYLIIGNSYDRDNSAVDSVSYYGCSGFVAQWDTMHPNLKDRLKNLLPFEICKRS